jgi:peptidoglycan/LPS O-acetylase OafA/YrhL
MKKKNINPALQALRGLMALMIAIGHSLLLFSIGGVNNLYERQFLDLPKNEAVLAQLLRTIFNGSAAVAFFFVLSGYLVNHSLNEKKFNIKTIIDYCLKRILRIYPIYLISLLVSGIYISYFHTYKTHSLASKWYLMWFNFKLTPRLIIDHLFFTNTAMNTVAWALGPIIVFSLLAPFFYFIFKRTSIKLNTIVIVILIISTYLIKQSDLTRYLFSFCIGLALPKFSKVFKNIINYSKINIQLAGLCAIVILLFARPMFLRSEILVKLIESISISLIIYLVVNHNTFFVNRIGQNRIMIFFGKISYSFYLLNFLIIYIITNFFLKAGISYLANTYLILISLLIGLLSIIVTTPIAYLMHEAIEKNFLSRKK